MKFSSKLRLWIASLFLAVLSIVTAFLSRREDNAPSLSRMYVPPQVYYAQEYLIASGLMLASAFLLFLLSFRKEQKKENKTEQK